MIEQQWARKCRRSETLTRGCRTFVCDRGVTPHAPPPRMLDKEKRYFSAAKVVFPLTRQQKGLSSIGDETAACVQDEDDICAVRGD
jgi:hypothetical protein